MHVLQWIMPSQVGDVFKLIILNKTKWCPQVGVAMGTRGKIMARRGFLISVVGVGENGSRLSRIYRVKNV